MSGYTHSADTPRHRAAAAVRDALAEYVAEGGSIKGFAREHNRDPRGTQKMWKRICEDLGPQAA